MQFLGLILGPKAGPKIYIFRIGSVYLFWEIIGYFFGGGDFLAPSPLSTSSRKKHVAKLDPISFLIINVIENPECPRWVKMLPTPKIAPRQVQDSPRQTQDGPELDPDESKPAYD